MDLCKKAGARAQRPGVDRNDAALRSATITGFEPSCWRCAPQRDNLLRNRQERNGRNDMKYSLSEAAKAAGSHKPIQAEQADGSRTATKPIQKGLHRTPSAAEDASVMKTQEEKLDLPEHAPATSPSLSMPAVIIALILLPPMPFPSP